MPALYVRVSCSGSKTWRLVGRIKGQKNQEVFDLGEYAPGTEHHLGLMAARNLAERYKAELRQGINPRERMLRQLKAKEAAEKVILARQELTFEKVRYYYFEHPAFLALKPNFQLGYRSVFRASEFDSLLYLPIDEIGRADIITVI